MARGGSWIHPSTRWSLYLQSGFMCERCARPVMPGRKTSKRGASIHHATPTSMARHGVVLCMQCNATLGEPTRLLDLDGLPSPASAVARGLYLPPWHSGWTRTLDARPLGRALARWHRGGARGQWWRHITAHRDENLAEVAASLTRRLLVGGNDSWRTEARAALTDLAALARGHCHASECPALWPWVLRTFISQRRAITSDRCFDAWQMLAAQGTGCPPSLPVRKAIR